MTTKNVPLSDGRLGVGSPYPNQSAAPAGSGLPDLRISANFQTKPEVIRGMSVLECSCSHRTMWLTLYPQSPFGIERDPKPRIKAATPMPDEPKPQERPPMSAFGDYQFEIYVKGLPGLSRSCRSTSRLEDKSSRGDAGETSYSYVAAAAATSTRRTSTSPRSNAGASSRA